jgi:hypothetical protein
MSLKTSLKLLHELPARIRNAYQYLLSRFPDTRDRIILGSCIIVVFILILISALMIANRSAYKIRTASFTEKPGKITVPPEEFFLSEEPDFIPGVLLEQEPRTTWSEQDAMQNWHDPLKNNEEFWRFQLEKAIDELMEHVQ